MREIESKTVEVADALAVVAARMFDEQVLQGASDSELMSALSSLGENLRRVEAALVATVAEVSARSPKTAAKTERLTVRQGCADVNELVRRATRVSRFTAGALVRAAEATGVETSIVSGEVLPAKLPQLREALRDGSTGVDGITAVAKHVAELEVCAGSEARDFADAYLATAARGESETGEPPACADTLRTHAQVLSTYFDPDGAEPRERLAMRRRGLTLAPGADGLISLKAFLMPEAAAQLQRVLDSHLNPAARPEFRPAAANDGEHGSAYGSAYVSGHEEIPDAPVDDRSPAQKRHDAFAAALDAAARSGDLPLLGGAAPTLVVTVRERDLATNTGYAYAEGVDEPVSLSAARHVACVGAVQRVTQTEAGRIVRLETRERVFNAHQRRAILARDGGCIIPGCHVRAAWCEIHHVTEHAEGGATHTDNGVALCFHHHRTLDVNGWRIRMRDGVPQVLAPEWWDRHRRWRSVTKHPTVMKPSGRPRAPDGSKAPDGANQPGGPKPPDRAKPPKGAKPPGGAKPPADGSAAPGSASPLSASPGGISAGRSIPRTGAWGLRASDPRLLNLWKKPTHDRSTPDRSTPDRELPP